MFKLLELSTVIYILSVSFQIAGSTLLIIKYLGKTRERVIEEYFPGSNVIEREENNVCVLKSDKVRKCARRVYDNRMSFIFIAIGFALSIFSENPQKYKIIILVLILICTMAIVLIEKVLAIGISHILYKNDIEIQYDKLKDQADTILTEQEINDLFD